MKKVLSAIVAVGCLAPAMQASGNAVFDFEETGFPIPALFSQPYSLKPVVGDGETQTVERSGSTSKVGVIEDQKGVILSPRSDSALVEGYSSLTLSLAFKVNEAAPTPIFVQRIQGSSSREGYFSFHSQNSHGDPNARRGTLRFVITRSGEPHTAASTERWNQVAGEWRTVAMVFDRGTVRFYLDGMPLGEPVETEVKAIPAIMTEGRVAWRSGNGFAGAIDDLVILPNRILDDAQIKLLHSSGTAAAEVREMLKP